MAIVLTVAAVCLLLFLLGKAGSHWMATIAVFLVSVQLLLAVMLHGSILELVGSAAALLAVYYLAYAAGRFLAPSTD